jgi:molybdopterin synthase catalytic subunit
VADVIKIIGEEEKISITNAIDQLRSPDVGAIVTFLGTVRSFSGEEKVKYLELKVSKETALKKLSTIERETKDTYDIKDVTIIHRVRRLGVGEDVLLVGVAAARRKDAFSACAHIVDELKRVVPEKEVTDRGGH